MSIRTRGLRRRSGAIAPWLAIALLAGCSNEPAPPPPPPGDGGGPAEPDGSAAVPRDTDGDGLCDGSELSYGTDPANADTDDDGLPDRVEVELGYKPARPDSPSREALTFLGESELASRQLVVAHIVRGDGENYTGAFEALPVKDRLDLTALDFYRESLAVGATPMENVFDVAPEEQRFYAVSGRTQLVFEVRFEFGQNVPRLCARAYPFRYHIKRSDGALMYAARSLLIVLPPGDRLDTTEWCVYEGGCI